MDMNKVLDEAIELDASDIHLVPGNKPMLRVSRELVPVRGSKILTPEDMNEIYDFLVRGNIDKDEVFNTTRKLDTSYEYKDIRLRVNISLTDDVPLCTLRLIKSELPPYESLGIPSLVFESIFLVLLFSLIKKKPNRIISKLSNLTMGVFLIHTIVLNYLGVNLLNLGLNLNGFWIFIVTTLILFLITYVIKKFKFLM